MDHVTRSDWKELDRREWIYLAVIFGFVPTFLFALLAFTAIKGDVPGWLGLAVGAFGVLGYFSVSTYLHGFRCPRCGEAFLQPYSNNARECARCHIKRGTIGVARTLPAASGTTAHTKPKDRNKLCQTNRWDKHED